MHIVKVFLLIFVLASTGIIFLRRSSQEKRAEVVFPAGIAIGLAVYIFILNLVAHFVKGPTGFYISLIVQIYTAILIFQRNKVESLVFPKNKKRIFWLISIITSLLLFCTVTASGFVDTGDAAMHYNLASLFTRGDYPMHSSFQPYYTAHYHIGVAELLGAIRTITGMHYHFLLSLILLISLMVIFQLIMWFPEYHFSKNVHYLYLYLIPAIGLISMGGFMFVWPHKLGLPDFSSGAISWIKQLPGIYDAYKGYGAPTNLDGLTLFSHRTLSLAILFSIFPVIFVATKKYKKLWGMLFVVMIAALALTDEAVFIVCVPGLIFITLFTYFYRHYFKWIAFCVVAIVVVTMQGGLIHKIVINSSEGSPIPSLFFPSDAEGPLATYYSYRNYRLDQQASKVIPDKDIYSPFRWFHFGIIWQLFFLFYLAIKSTNSYFKKQTSKRTLYLVWLLFVTSLTAAVSFHAIVPGGMWHVNGIRFLSLAYQLSGLGIIYCLVNYFISGKISKVKYLVLAWILFFSILPPFFALFPRRNLNFFLEKPPAVKSYMSWIKDNIPFDKYILFLVEVNPTGEANAEFMREVGGYIPLWPKTPVVQGFDTNPYYSDLFYTLNPERLEQGSVEYLVISDNYRDILASERLPDLDNQNYFQTVHVFVSEDVTIYKVLPKFLEEGENIGGTYSDLSRIAPTEGKYYVEGNDGISQTDHRCVFLALSDRELYYNPKKLSYYNFSIDIFMRHYGNSSPHYDYLVLGKNTDPETVCGCKAEIYWSSRFNDINLWKVL